MSLFPPDVFSTDIHQVRNRGVSPKSLSGMGFVPCLRKFAQFNSALRQGLAVPPVRLHRDADGVLSVHENDKILLSVIEMYKDNTTFRVRNKVPQKVFCRTSKRALELARLGYFAVVKYPDGRETFRLDDGLIEHVIRTRKDGAVNTILEYVS